MTSGFTDFWGDLQLAEAPLQIYKDILVFELKARSGNTYELLRLH
jgi:hypothetical protein